MIKVFNISDLIKYSIKILVVFVTAFFLIRFFSSKGQNIKASDKTMLSCIDQVLPEIKVNNKKEQASIKMPNSFKYAITSELKVLSSISNNSLGENETQEASQNIKGNESEEKSKTNENAEVNIEVSKIDENATVTEVQNSGVNPRSTDEFMGVKINNSTDYTLTQDMLTPNIDVNKGKVVIYHTHTCESYTKTENNNYEESGSFRTIDLNYSVSRVGDELTNQLLTYGCNVIHDKTYHDYPAYNGSYSRSLATAQNILNENNDADIVIDLHRDAIADETYAPKVKIGDEYVSQLMFVIGSDVANTEHTNWLQNLQFAIKVQQKANEMYNGLFKPIILRNSEYNQHIAKAACIIEVGATGNTLEESICAMKYLAKILEEI